MNCSLSTSNVWIYRQEGGAALDSSQRVVNYCSEFDVVQKIHEVITWKQFLPNMTKAPLAGYLCIQARIWKKPAVWSSPSLDMRHECSCSNLSVGLSEHACWLLQLCSELARSWNQFFQLRPFRQRTHKTVVIKLINIFCILDHHQSFKLIIKQSLGQCTFSYMMR